KVSYAVTARRNGVFEPARVSEIRRENSAGTLLDADDGEARWVVRDLADGSNRIDVFDHTDRLVRAEDIESPPPKDRLTVNFRLNTVPIAQAATREVAVNLVTGERPFTGKTEITRHEVLLDPQGFVVERRFQDQWGTPRYDGNGSYGQRFINS